MSWARAFCGKRLRSFLRCAVALLLAGPLHGALASSVLVLYSNNRLVPGNIAVDRGLREGIAQTISGPLGMYSEFLDAPEFTGDAYAATMTNYLREKYASHPPDVIVAVSDDALLFLLKQRAQIFPGKPIVYVAVTEEAVRASTNLPADVTGVAVRYEYAATIDLALHLHPSARKIVIVTGASSRDRWWEELLRRLVPSAAAGRTVQFLSALPVAQLQSALRGLGAESIVFTPGFFADGGGRQFSPRDAAAVIASASNAPVYGPFDTFVGTGAVGGRVPSFVELGKRGATFVSLALAAGPDAAMPPAEVSPNHVELDWRQVKRWKIDPRQIPDDAVLQYKERSFLDEYRPLLIAGLVVMLLQAGLIANLLVERRRRMTAQSSVRRQRVELLHASRLAVAGELTASIAHEINQPLGAMRTNADAAEMIIEGGGDRRDDLLRIIGRIKDDSLRASEVIRRLRTLLARHDPEWLPFDLNLAMADAQAFLVPEVHRRGMELVVQGDATPLRVNGDQTQFQQVLINLILNAMDAMDDTPAGKRIVTVRTGRLGPSAIISVKDVGHGIAHYDIPKVFNSFFSTKKAGMGLGLAIARTIVEAHGGRIDAASDVGTGAMFTVTLPLVEPAQAS